MNLSLQELSDQFSRALAPEPHLTTARLEPGAAPEGEAHWLADSPNRFPRHAQAAADPQLDVLVLPGRMGHEVGLLEPDDSAVGHATSAVQVVDYLRKGYHLEVTVSPYQVVISAALLDHNGFSLDTITGVDWIAQGEMEVVYDYFHPASPFRVVVRSRIPRAKPEIPTISGVFPGANWHERETHDFFGIDFLGHPDLTPFLLPEDADYHPLRKDFIA